MTEEEAEEFLRLNIRKVYRENIALLRAITTDEWFTDFLESNHWVLSTRMLSITFEEKK